jgi:hypothetical protein
VARSEFRLNDPLAEFMFRVVISHVKKSLQIPFIGRDATRGFQPEAGMSRPTGVGVSDDPADRRRHRHHGAQPDALCSGSSRSKWQAAGVSTAQTSARTTQP